MTKNIRKEWYSIGQMFSAPQPDFEKYDTYPTGPEKTNEPKTRRTVDIPQETKGGLSKGMTVSSIAKKHGVSDEQIKSQLKIGIKVEKEHTDSNIEAAKIALDHLVEDPQYYTKLKKIESDKT